MSYTRPEHACERTQARRKMAKILTDPCAHCLRRDPQTVFGQSVCSSSDAGRNWWTCVRDGRQPTFDLDERTVE